MVGIQVAVIFISHSESQQNKLCLKLFYDPVCIGNSIKAEDDEMTGACILYKGKK
jgi:hypothetical protein